MSILALPIYISHPSTLALAVALTWLWVMANSSLDVNITIVVTFLAGLLLFVSKLKFVFKIFDSKVQVTVFNHSLALCLLASGDVITKKQMFINNVTFQSLAGIGTIICLPASIWLLDKQAGSYEEIFFKTRPICQDLAKIIKMPYIQSFSCF